MVSLRTASARTPSRFTSEMSRTTSTSTSLRPLAPMSLASRTSSPRRNLYMSGHGVGLTILERIPIWPSSRASAVSEPQPSPSALMWVDIATERPARSSCARRSIDSRRCWGTLRRSSTAFRAGQLRVRSAVGEVDDQADSHPVNQSLPRSRGQTVHHVSADENAENRHNRHEWGAEWARQVRRLVPQRDDTRADDHESEQGSDRHQLAEQADREESGHHGGDDSGQYRRHVWGLEPGMHLPENRRQQAVARHRIEYARLSHEHDQHDRSETRNGANVDDRAQPGKCRPGLFDRHENRMRNIEVFVAGEAGHYERHQDVEHRTDGERAKDSYRHVALRIFRFLRRCRYRVESDVGEKHDRRTAHDSAPAVVSVLAGVRRKERVPVRLIHVHEAEADHQQNDGDL